jgi:hypothetical protein
MFLDGKRIAGRIHAVEPNLYFGSDLEATAFNHPGSDEWR